MTALDDVRARFELWFFRDLSDAQRMALFRVCGMPVEEITSHSTQKHVLRHLLPAHADLSGEVRELVEALEAAEELHRVGLFNAKPGQIERVIELRQAALAKFTQEKP